MFKNTKQELYANLDPSIKFFLHHARPLSVIEGRYDNFIYANYIQLNKNESKKYLFDIYPQFGNGATFGNNVIDDLLENYIITGDCVHYNYEEFKHLVCSQIDKGYYLQTFNNEAIIPETLLYRHGKFLVHQGFYYGYDLSRDVFYMLNFDENRIYRKIEVDMRIAFDSIFSKEMTEYLLSKDRIRPFNDFMLDFYKFKEPLYEYNYSTERVLHKIEKFLQDYIYCRDSTSENELIYKSYQDSSWGMDVYDYFIKYCEGEYQTTFGLQCFCGIFEHKVLMKKRFDFLKSNNIGISNENYSTLEEIIQEAEIMKNFHMLCSMKHDYTKLNKCVSRINKIRELEGNLLIDVVKKMKEGFYY